MLSITIVTPTYNQAKYLPETIDSVLNQTYQNIDYWIINGPSTDNTEGVLEAYGDKIKWETHAHMGQADAINYIWKKCNSDIIAFINSDDVYMHSRVVEEAIEYLDDNNDVAIVYGRCVFTDELGFITGEYGSSGFDYETVVLTCSNPIPQPSTFIRNDIAKKYNYLDDSYKFSLDWEFWLRVGKENKIAFIPSVWATYRLHNQSKTLSQLSIAAEEAVRIYSNIMIKDENSQYLTQNKNIIMRNVYVLAANLYIKSGKKYESVKCYIQAIKYDANISFLEYVKMFMTFLPGAYAIVKWLRKLLRKL